MCPHDVDTDRWSLRRSFRTLETRSGYLVELNIRANWYCGGVGSRNSGASHAIAGRARPHRAAGDSPTTLPASIVAAGNAYARHLIGAQPIPPEAREVTSLPTPLAPNGDVGESPEVRQVHHLYMLPLSVSVDQYVRAHLL